MLHGSENRAGGERISRRLWPVAIKFVPLAVIGLVTGCATTRPPMELSSPIDRPAAAPALTYVSIGPRPVVDELRLFDSRAILKLRQSGLLPGAIYLTRPQKVAIIAGTTIVGMYLITEWIEDELAVFP